MEVSQAPASFNLNLYSLSVNQGKKQENLLVLNASFQASGSSSEKVQVDFSGLDKALQIKLDRILKKLSEILKDPAPKEAKQRQSEKISPEVTATRIFEGAVALFDKYAKQNPNLEKEELLKSFMQSIRQGVEQGYKEASAILEGLGAFEIEGVKEAIEESMRLLEEKLSAFESYKAQEFGIEKTKQ